MKRRRNEGEGGIISVDMLPLNLQIQCGSRRITDPKLSEKSAVTVAENRKIVATIHKKRL